MMTTSMNSVNMVLVPHQAVQSVQPRANEKPAEELKEERQEVESGSTQKISIGKSPMDLRMFGIHKAAEAGLLRPVWLEMMEMMNTDMPRTRDLITRAEKYDAAESDLIAYAAERTDTPGLATTGGDKRAVESEGAKYEIATRTDNSGRIAADGAKQAGKSESVSDGTPASAGKSGHAATSGTGHAVASSE